MPWSNPQERHQRCLGCPSPLPRPSRAGRLCGRGQIPGVCRHQSAARGHQNSRQLLAAADVGGVPPGRIAPSAGGGGLEAQGRRPSICAITIIIVILIISIIIIGITYLFNYSYHYHYHYHNCFYVYAKTRRTQVKIARLGPWLFPGRRT